MRQAFKQAVVVLLKTFYREILGLVASPRQCTVIMQPYATNDIIQPFLMQLNLHERLGTETWPGCQ